MELSGYLLSKRGGSEIYKIPVFLCQAVQVFQTVMGRRYKQGYDRSVDVCGV